MKIRPDVGEVHIRYADAKLKGAKYNNENSHQKSFEPCIHVNFLREKGRDLTQSYDKSPYTNRNVKR